MRLRTHPAAHERVGVVVRAACGWLVLVLVMVMLVVVVSWRRGGRRAVAGAASIIDDDPIAGARVAAVVRPLHEGKTGL